MNYVFLAIRKFCTQFVAQCTILHIEYIYLCLGFNIGNVFV